MTFHPTPLDAQLGEPVVALRGTIRLFLGEILEAEYIQDRDCGKRIAHRSQFRVDFSHQVSPQHQIQLLAQVVSPHP